MVTSPYLASPYRYLLERVLPSFIPKGAKVILDYGCGSGIYRHWFTWETYVGVDTDNRFKWRDVFIVADGKNLPFPNGIFDLVLCNAVLEHIKEDVQAVKEIHRVLKLRGAVIVGVPSIFTYTFTLGRHGHHYYTKKVIKRLIETQGFIIEKAESLGGLISLMLATVRTLYLTQKKGRVVKEDSRRIGISRKNRVYIMVLQLTAKIDRLLRLTPGGYILLAKKS